MVLVDSKVWISFLKRKDTQEVHLLTDALQNSLVLMCDLVAMDVLRGISKEQDFQKVKTLFLKLEQVGLSSPKAWIESIDWYRKMRKSGFTIWSQVDILLAMYSHKTQIPLLHNDCDFDAINQFYAFPDYKRNKLSV